MSNLRGDDNAVERTIMTSADGNEIGDVMITSVPREDGAAFITTDTHVGSGS